MKEREFKEWLQQKYPDNEGTVRNRLTNCKKVERYYGDLDKHFVHDRCSRIISELSYSTNDEKENRKPNHPIPIDGNIRTGSATLKQAVGLYVEFESGNSSIPVKHTQDEKVFDNKKAKTKDDDVFYFGTNSDYEKTIAIVLGEVSCFIHPKIVDRIREANRAFKKDFQSICGNLDADIFLFDGSDCIFPGIRRSIHKEETGKWKHNINAADNTILDGNEFPRHIWSFLSMNKPYGSKNWNDSKLNKFELAHIFGHKPDEKKLEKEVFNEYDDRKLPYTFFTSASNTVLIPNGLMKPTDKCKTVRVAFFQHYIDLYGTDSFYAEKEFDNNLIPKWYNEIKWLEPVLPPNWEIRIDNLLEYRKKRLIDIYSNK